MAGLIGVLAMRKPNNMQSRMRRSLSAILRSNHVAVVNLDPSGRQGLVNYRNCKSIATGQRIADALCDYGHRWTIYVAGLCVDQDGSRYIKASEAAPQGVYLAAHLTDVIEEHYKALLGTCNPNHLVASGWLAIPNDVSLDESQAAAVFAACGAWDQQKECA